MLAGEKRLLELVALGRPLQLALSPCANCGIRPRTVARARSCCSIVPARDFSTCWPRACHRATTRALEGRAVHVDEGPYATAASMKMPVIVSDVTAQTRWNAEGWPNLALSNGLKSCWCSPLFSLSGELLGVLAIYQREPGSPSPYHQVLIQQFSHIASIAIEQRQNAEALERSEAFLSVISYLKPHAHKPNYGKSADTPRFESGST